MPKGDPEVEVLRKRVHDLYRVFDSLDMKRTAPFYSKAFDITPKTSRSPHGVMLP